MFDCSKEFNKFYRTKVVLSEKEQNKLREKRKLNIKRLKDGLVEYNEENNKNYKVAEDRIQGSMAMHTVVKNDEMDYDIDVGIVFEADNLENLGPQATRNMLANALERKTKQFTEDPEVKTGCIRIKYSEGYHVDFAIFKRNKENEWEDGYSYEHAGAEWSKRELKALEEWFVEEIKEKGDELRKIVRLSKMFCKSRDSWKNMPSGLIQTVICNENIDTRYERLDEIFYYTLKDIVNRLNYRLEVEAPVDNGRALVIREIDYKKMKNWKNRLAEKLEDLEILFHSACSRVDAIKAWNSFFNHSYWKELEDSVFNEDATDRGLKKYDDTEDFIDTLYPVYEKYNVVIGCVVTGNGFTDIPILKYLTEYVPKFIPFNFKVKCKIKDTNCPSYDKILWKVKNVGEMAKIKNCIRGQIKERGREITEPTSFRGAHYIECYLIKNGVCVAIGHVDVPIGEM